MKMEIRTVTLDDAEGILEIYAPYVRSSHITFETEMPTLEEFRSKIKKTIARFPWYVATFDQKIRGYAYASLFRERAAYAWALESSIYLAEDFQGKSQGSVASQLYEALFNDLRSQNIKQVIGVISLPNDKSVRFHEKHGFISIGTFPSVGFKNNQWWDVLFMTKFLEDLPFSPPVI